ncbi:MAG: M23 family metallopeptidase [Oscillospiraceae bacterium]|nr:M23 family metallopeptidase [Oscillospiraceae bacterium]
MRKNTAGRRPRRGREGYEPDTAGVWGMQVLLCVALICAAAGLRAAGLPLYEELRDGFSQAVQEPDIDLAQVLPALSFGVQRPEEGGRAEADADMKTPETENLPEQGKAGAPAESSEEKLAKLQGYIQRYLPEGAEKAGEAAPVQEEEGPEDAGLSGGQGGYLPTAFPAAGKTWKAPEGVSLSPVITTARALLPLPRATVTCRFGYRYHPVTGEEDFHTGIDLAAPEGTAVAAAFPGVVEEAGESPVYGRYILLRHGSMTTFYGHCSELCAPLGANIRQGETVAKVGSTGVSTGPHLHFEVKVGSVTVNPAYLLMEDRLFHVL